MLLSVVPSGTVVVEDIVDVEWVVDAVGDAVVVISGLSVVAMLWFFSFSFNSWLHCRYALKRSDLSDDSIIVEIINKIRKLARKTISLFPWIQSSF